MVEDNRKNSTFALSENAKKELVFVAGAAAVGTQFAIVPARAVDDPNLTSITNMVTSLGGLATAVTAVVVGAMVVRLGIKFVNRMTVKG